MSPSVAPLYKAASAHRVGDSHRVRGLHLTDHFFEVPLDHWGSGGGSRAISVYAREVVAADKADSPKGLADMPWLFFLQARVVAALR